MSDEPSTTEDAATSARRFGGGRFSAGMPAEQSKDFRGTLKRLLALMAPNRGAAITVVVSGSLGVLLAVIAPKVLGNATDTIVRGAFGPDGIDGTTLRNQLLFAIALFAGSSALQWGQSYLIADLVQRSMQRLRTQVEDKLARVPLSYVDRTPLGDLLSRVTNDIDNLSSSLQQSMSQVLTSALTIVGVLVAMLLIDWVLGLIALVTIPASLLIVRFITRRSKGRFVAQWSHTGDLNAQIEEAFTGHTLIRVLGRQEDVRRRFYCDNFLDLMGSAGSVLVAA